MSEDTTLLDEKIAEATEDWANITLALSSYDRVLLHGDPGTGKSRASKSDERCYLTMDMPAAEIRGHYLPSEEGGFRWHDGPATTSWRNGTRLGIEEIDAASGDCLTALLGYLDDKSNAYMTLPSGETIRPADGFSVVATTNELPSVLQANLLDRFEVVYNVQFPNPEAFKGWHNEDLAQIARKTLFLRTNESASRTPDGRKLGLRGFRAVDQGLARGLELEKAAQLTLGKEVGQWLCAAIRISAI